MQGRRVIIFFCCPEKHKSLLKKFCFLVNYVLVIITNLFPQKLLAQFGYFKELLTLELFLSEIECYVSKRDVTRSVSSAKEHHRDVSLKG